MTTKSGLEYIKGAVLKADAWARGDGEFNRDGQPPAGLKAFANLNPLIAVPNAQMVLVLNKDVYGIKVTSKFDKTMAVVGAISSFSGFGLIGEAAAVKLGTAAAKVGAATDIGATVVGASNDLGLLDGIKNPQPKTEEN
ncbi:hypothetical protein [[Flexibacter] sp. ATCC 35208]|uniref:hypothetical protein n=1 Tax=[Flexibacter] sp. ATCC 35208 TaxID=1936242 RepID=UPI0009C94679|nr:hypothetical protein [[Flexibacter] sp. ATCC 35208]OMP74870.1 hypothetical protein BW716_33090 [[Flexibacter] sp. ATCC 35208]